MAISEEVAKHIVSGMSGDFPSMVSDGLETEIHGLAVKYGLRNADINSSRFIKSLLFGIEIDRIRLLEELMGSSDDIGTVMIIKGKENVDKTVLDTFLGASPSDERIRLCVDSLSTFEQEEALRKFNDVIVRNNQRVEVLLVSENGSKEYRDAIGRVKKMTDRLKKIGPGIKLEVRTARNPSTFRYVILGNSKLVFVTGGREQAFQTDDRAMISWFQRVFDFMFHDESKSDTVDFGPGHEPEDNSRTQNPRKWLSEK